MQNSLSGKRIIVTGGPTREYLDPVRFISNASSGKMGRALADAALKYSDDVIFIHGPVDSSTLAGLSCRSMPVITNSEMYEAVKESLKDGCILIMSAAPADYRPASFSSRKIKKSDEKLSFDFIPNIDILKSVSEHVMLENMKDVFLCGFAAETDNLIENAVSKIRRKNLDMICLNDVTEKGSGFGTDTNRITVIDSDGGITRLEMAQKTAVAGEILKIIERKSGGSDE